MFSFLNNSMPNAFRKASVEFNPSAMRQEESPFRSLASRFSVAPDNTLEDDVQAETVRRNNASQPDRFQEPESPMSDLFVKFLSESPRSEDYQPGKMRRLSAALSGFGAGMRDPNAGIDVSEKILRQPYDRAVEDYNSRGSIINKMAELEAAGHKNSLEYRKLYNEFLDKQADNTREDEKVGIDKGRLKVEEDRLKFDEGKNTKEMEFKYDELLTKGWRETYDDQGNLIMVNPQNNAKTNFGKTFKAREMAVDDMNAATNRTNAAANTTRANAAVTVANNSGAGQGARDINAAANKTRADTYAAYTKWQMGRPNPIKLQEQMLAQVAAARELIAAKPEYKNFFDLETSTLSSGEGMFGRDATLYRQFENELDIKTKQKLMEKYPNDDNEEAEDLGDINDLDVGPAPVVAPRRPGSR